MPCSKLVSLPSSVVWYPGRYEKQREDELTASNYVLLESSVSQKVHSLNELCGSRYSTWRKKVKITIISRTRFDGTR